MIFSSVFFLSTFLPITLGLYFIAPRPLRNGILFIASLLFYAWGEPVYVGFMIYSTILDYTCGLGIERNWHHAGKKKFWLWVSILGNLGLLGYFKYADFLIGNINLLLATQIPLVKLALPIGISFYTFQTMSYTIDVYLGNCKTQHNIVSFGCYVTMFPQLIAGPIVRYVDVVKEIDDRKESVSEFAQGVHLFVVGLGKKVLLANSIGMLWDTTLQTYLLNQQISMVAAWLGILAFSFQLYFDFSGYSDMATGMGYMFGFKFPKNFNYPYTSTSVSDFWRRWHMTLGTWFKEYVYIPLGGNRGTTLQWVRNVAVVWFLTGLWHGASWNFVLWGLYFGVVLAVEKVFLQKYLAQMTRWISWLYTMLVIIIAWCLFSIESLPMALAYIKTLFGGAIVIDSFARYQLANYSILLVVLAVAATPLWRTVVKPFQKKPALSYMQIIYTLVLLICCIAYLVDASYNPFLYFRF